jgi:hypothetical protein
MGTESRSEVGVCRSGLIITYFMERRVVVGNVFSHEASEGQRGLFIHFSMAICSSTLRLLLETSVSSRLVPLQIVAPCEAAFGAMESIATAGLVTVESSSIVLRLVLNEIFLQ